ncbi:MAG: hypothetical protein JWM73_700 [Solirubrobacterales bacterium]|nr:hypothetical protein [Solirubrobacterales bacterium]
MAGGMDQISRPLLIALVAVVGLAGVWMTVLRPKAAADTGGSAAVAPVAASTHSATAPGVGGLERAVDKAKGAVATSQASATAAEAAAGQTTTPVRPAPVRPAPVTTAPAPVTEAAPAPTRTAAPAAARTVLLFAGSGADDDVARHVVRSVRRPGVKVIVASLAQVVDYQDLLGTIEITASPTILVFGKDHKAHLIEGLPDVGQVEQALRAAG